MVTSFSLRRPSSGQNIYRNLNASVHNVLFVNVMWSHLQSYSSHMYAGCWHTIMYLQNIMVLSLSYNNAMSLLKAYNPLDTLVVCSTVYMIRNFNFWNTWYCHIKMSTTSTVTLWRPVSVTAVKIMLLFSDISKGTLSEL